MKTPRFLSPRSASHVLPVLILCALPSAAQRQAPPQQPSQYCDPYPPPAFRPWIYEPGSAFVAGHRRLWGFHQHYEDQGRCAYSIADEWLAVPGESALLPDVLLFNTAHFVPPEGVDVPKRRFMAQSLEHRGLQLHVNYSGASKPAPNQSDSYLTPTFFVSLDQNFLNEQPEPAVPESGFSDHFISATSGVRVTVDGVEGLYVTAGLGFGLGDIDDEDLTLATEAQRDRLLRYENAHWVERNDLLPAGADTGNASGVAMADFNLDGLEDLYVGKCGDRFAGAADVLLLQRSGDFEDHSSTYLDGTFLLATTDVAAADLDGDSDPDLVVSARLAWDGGTGDESRDVVLWNQWVESTQGGTVPGTLSFVYEVLNSSNAAKSTVSIAVGDMGENGSALPETTSLEIVLVQEGPNPYSNDLTVNGGGIQIFARADTPGSTYGDVLRTQAGPNIVSPNHRGLATDPHPRQVLLHDLVGDDGELDIVIVNSRDHLKNDSAKGHAGSIDVLEFKSGQTPLYQWNSKKTIVSPWATSVALADFDTTGASAGRDDVFHGRGNRFNGTRSFFSRNIGSDDPWDSGITEHLSYDALAGTDHGYGFDFADIDDDGLMDAIQTGRGYNYFVRGLLSPTSSGSYQKMHTTLTSIDSPVQLSNSRGRLVPRGGEDAVFGDFDEDGDIDAVFVGQTRASVAWGNEFALSNMVPDTIVLEKKEALGADFVFDKEIQGSLVADKKIDLNGRTQDGTLLADRANAGDLDNDGDLDVLVRLGREGGTSPTPLQLGNDVYNVSYGWRYLENLLDQNFPGGRWFRDVATDGSGVQSDRIRSTDGEYASYYNRGLGMDVLADFNGDGTLDLFSTGGKAVFAVELGTLPGAATSDYDVEGVMQGQSLLFLNGVQASGQPGTLGTLYESTGLLPLCEDEVEDFAFNGGTYAHDTCGGWGTAQGDIDNDGDPDLFVSLRQDNGYTNNPQLLVNRLQETAAAFTNEWSTRVGTLSGFVHTESFPDGSPLEDGDCGVFFDFDADGDLDLVYQVTNDYPRFLSNRGRDVNGDGLIDASDLCPPGTFTDVTAAAIAPYRKASTGSDDIMVVDVDGDGDFDLVNDAFSDQVTFWRNDLDLGDPVGFERPAVTDIWPRVGRLRGEEITLHGVHFDDVDRVQLRYPGGVRKNMTPTSGSSTRLTCTVPSDSPLGLAQVRVRRTIDVNGTLTKVWSTQYFGYFVQGQ